MERANARHKKTQSHVPPGGRSDLGGNTVSNALLLSLPDAEFSLLQPHLELVELPQQLIVHQPREPITFAYFLNHGMASLVVLTSDGESVEVAIVGKEGMIGTPLAVGLTYAPWRAIIQVRGAGLRIRAEALQQVLQDAPELRLILSRYLLIQSLQVAQIAACNRLHSIEQRLARWLLMCQDRVNSDLLPVTHELLSQMLGAGRPSVSLVAGNLQRAGIIRNLRGSLKIIARDQLEKLACECYRSILRFDGNS